MFCYTYLNFQVPSTNKWLITPLFFSPSLILFYFYNLSFFIFIMILSPPHVYIHWVLSHFKFQKASHLLTFGQRHQSSHGLQKKNSKFLRSGKDIKKMKKKKKKIRETQTLQRPRRKWKAKQKRDQDTRKMHQIVKFVEKLS